VPWLFTRVTGRSVGVAIDEPETDGPLLGKGALEVS